MISNGRVQPMAIERDRVCIESEKKVKEPTSCHGCRYDKGNLDCDHPKVNSKHFSEWPMRECYKPHDMKNGKIATKKDITFYKVDQ
jgi:hypothetical protein